MVEKQKAKDAPDKRLGPFEVGQILTLSREGLSQCKIVDKAPLRAMLAPVGVADGAPEGPPGVHLAAGQGIWWRMFTTTNALWIKQRPKQPKYCFSSGKITFQEVPD